MYLIELYVFIMSWLWFGVGIRSLTTTERLLHLMRQLWFGVGIRSLTTFSTNNKEENKLWFGVGIRSLTTDKSTMKKILEVVVRCRNTFFDNLCLRV